MKASPWRHWWWSEPSEKRIGRATRRGHRRPLRLLVLEDRTLPSGSPHMVLDINTATPPSDPEGLVAVGSTLYFADNDGRGIGLWKSDGTAAGTTLVKLINRGL